MSQSIQQRKKDHVDLCLTDEVNYDSKNGFDRYVLRHNALPEINLDDVNTSTSFLGHHISAPIFISSMTGGFAGSEHINAKIARVCEELHLPFGLGSQRSMLVHPSEEDSFRTARKNAPSAFIAANIGGVQLISDFDSDDVRKAIDVVEANALIIHLNPLQELIQQGGDVNFRGILAAIERLCKTLETPIIVKETGAGINGSVAKKLYDVGVSCVDVAGKGGTSWSKVERLRNESSELQEFDNWGLETAQCLVECAKIRPKGSFLIASGGIYDVIDMMKSLALGADLVGVARPVLQTIYSGGEEALFTYLSNLVSKMAKACLLLGVENIDELNDNVIQLQQ